MRAPSSTLRTLKLAAVSTAVVATGLGMAPSALAAAPAAAAAPHAAQYGTGGCVAGLNATLVVQGNTVTITIRCNGNVVVLSVVINSTPTPLAIVAPDANGDSTYTVDTSNLELGDHTAVITYSDGTSQTLPFTVTRPQASGVPQGTGNSASGGSTGGLAFTGANAVVPLGAIGAVLVLGGAGAYVAGRRRKDGTA